MSSKSLFSTRGLAQLLRARTARTFLPSPPPRPLARSLLFRALPFPARGLCSSAKPGGEKENKPTRPPAPVETDGEPEGLYVDVPRRGPLTTGERVRDGVHVLTTLQYHGWSILHVSVGVLLVLGLSLGLLKSEFVKRMLGTEGASVASTALKDESVIRNSEELTKQVLAGLLGDERTHDLATAFIMTIAASGNTRRSVADLLSEALKDPSFRQTAQEFFAWQIDQLSQREDVSAALGRSIRRAIGYQESREHFSALAEWVANSPRMQLASANLAKNSMHSLLDDEGVRDHAVKYITGVLGDSELKVQAGYHIWDAVRYSVTPRYWLGPAPGQAKESTGTTEPTAVDATIPTTTTTTTKAKKKEHAGKPAGEKTGEKTTARPKDAKTGEKQATKSKPKSQQQQQEEEKQKK